MADWRRQLDGFTDRYCPIVKQFDLNYHWSLDRVEFATDVVLQRQSGPMVCLMHVPSMRVLNRLGPG